MDDDLLMRRGRIEKQVANPAQVALLLLGKRHAGADASMHKGVITRDHDILESAQELAVRIGHDLAHRVGQFGIIIPVILILAHAIAQDGLTSADSAEKTHSLFIAIERFQEHLLMIAHQEACLRLGVGNRHGALDDPGRIGTAINQVAQKNQPQFSRRATGMIGHDLLKQCVEQIRTAMDIANRIDPLPRRGDGKRPGRGDFLKQKANHGRSHLNQTNRDR